MKYFSVADSTFSNPYVLVLSPVLDSIEDIYPIIETLFQHSFRYLEVHWKLCPERTIFRCLGMWRNAVSHVWNNTCQISVDNRMNACANKDLHYVFYLKLLSKLHCSFKEFWNISQYSNLYTYERPRVNFLCSSNWSQLISISNLVSCIINRKKSTGLNMRWR